MEEAKKICNALADIKFDEDGVKNKQLIKSLKQCAATLPVQVWCGGKLYPVKDCLVCTNTGRDWRAYIVLLDKEVILEDKTYLDATDEDWHIE